MKKALLTNLICVFLGLYATMLFADTIESNVREIKVTHHGGASLDFGRIMQSSNVYEGFYSDTWQQSAGGVISTDVQFPNEKIMGKFGMGVVLTFPDQGEALDAAQMRTVLFPFLTNANLIYSFVDNEKTTLKLNMGYFGFKYNNQVRNLGEYLLRGTVYPGYMFGGFEKNSATIYGLHLHSKLFKNLKQDIIVDSETEIKPFFDISPAYMISYSFGGILEIGTGANYYHLFSLSKGLTTPAEGDTIIKALYPSYYHVDSTSGDTTFYTHKGLKLMGRITIDPKPLFPSDIFAENDLKLYAEAAIIGYKNYPIWYEKRWERVAMMLGFNFPTFKILDVLSFETEWFGSKYENDFRNLTNQISPIPKVDVTDTIFHPTKDDIKWSVYAARSFGNHIRLSFQVANDHTRTGGTGYYPTFEAALIRPTDWYFKTRLGFGF